MKILILIINICCLFASCKTDSISHDEKIVNHNNLNNIKTKYNAKEINYFYEVVFYSDGENKVLNHLKKWNSDIYISLHGKYKKNDSIAVVNSIKKINDLELSIKMKLTSDENKSNTKIYFGNTEYLETIFKTSKFNGIAKITQRHGVIRKAEIGITDVYYDSIKKKEALVLEEITQVLGVSGDSYSYPESVFYEAHNYPTQFTEIDKKIISLLYDSNIPPFYSIENFKVDFSDLLYSIDTNDKLKKIIVDNNISKEALISIKQSFFNDTTFFKHPSKIPVYLQGDFNNKDREFLNKTINSFNEGCSNFSIFLGKDNEFNPVSGIYINYIAEKELKHIAMSRVTNTNGYAMFPKIVKSVIDIKYKKDVSNQKERNRNLIQSFYKALAPIKMKNFEKNWFVLEEDKLVINKRYKDLIDFVYNKNFVDGYKLKCFNVLIESL